LFPVFTGLLYAGLGQTAPHVGPAIEEHGQLVANRPRPNARGRRVAVQRVEVNAIFPEGARIAAILFLEVEAGFVGRRTRPDVLQVCQHLQSPRTSWTFWRVSSVLSPVAASASARLAAARASRQRPSW